MKFLRITPIALSAALATAQTLSTIQLTITTCTGNCAATSDVAPSSFVYANTSVPVTTPTSSKKHRSTIYEYNTAYADSTFDVTKTICDENSLCYTTTDVESLATLTTTVDGILTVLTTPVPVSSVPTLVGADLSSAAPASSASSSAALSTLESVSAAPAASTPAASTVPATSTAPTSSSISAEPDTTLVSTLVVTPATVYDTVSYNSVEWITRTQCHNDVCVTVVDKNTLTTYTTTENGILTVVTTFCPESLTSSAAPAVTSTSASTSASTAPTTAPTTSADSILTETHASTTVVTITSCADNKCTKVPVTTGVTVVTTTINDKVTEYTTYCPLTGETTEPVAPTSSTAPAPAPSSKAPVSGETTVTETHKSQTVITVTSCSDDKCSTKPVTTGLTTVTDNETVYTTYCPLSETKEPAPSSSPVVSPEPVTPQTTSEVVASTINVITDNIVTETPPPVVTLVSSSTSQPPVPTVPTVTSYNVASTKQFAGVLGFIVPLFVALI